MSGRCDPKDLFERFTQAARQVVVYAQQEARDLGHNHIGTEHELLGLLRVSEGPVADVLGSLGITVDDARGQVVSIVGSGEVVTSGQMPFTLRAKKVLELSLREALALGHKHIGPEHLLLGLVSENDGVANRILVEAGADLERLRAQLLSLLPGPDPEIVQPPRVGAAAVSSVSFASWFRGLESVLGPLDAEIRAEQRRRPDLGDLLLVLACGETLAARALKDMDVDLVKLARAIEQARGEVERNPADEEIEATTQAKLEAIEAQDWERAAGLRERERRLRWTDRERQSEQAEATRKEARRLLGLSEAHSGS